MPTLTVEAFSTIKEACLDVKPLTILIGPQASGKSVLAKLLYFFISVLRDQYDAASEGNDVRQFRRRISRQFRDLFPYNAWGSGTFKLEYKAGPIRIAIKRRANRTSSLNDVSVFLSPFFVKHYEDTFANYRRIARSEADDEFAPDPIGRNWRVQHESLRFLSSELGKDHILYQLFVPAGRSFFTNLGKAVAMLEYGSQLDEITKQFGRMFTSLLDGTSYYGDRPTGAVKDFLSYQKDTMAEIFGGEIKLSQNEKHVNTPDGRRIPLSLLSSGQQELLPLLLILQSFSRRKSFETRLGVDLLYIEEPEAHLFPSSQAAVVRHLAEISNFLGGTANFFITTHSPYVLSTLNTLLKASAVGRIIGKKQKVRITEVVKETCWIGSERVGAYALENGTLTSIMDEDGLLEGSYLDAISEEISTDFMTLLGLEVQGD